MVIWDRALRIIKTIPAYHRHSVNICWINIWTVPTSVLFILLHFKSRVNVDCIIEVIMGDEFCFFFLSEHLLLYVSQYLFVCFPKCFTSGLWDMCMMCFSGKSINYQRNMCNPPYTPRCSISQLSKHIVIVLQLPLSYCFLILIIISRELWPWLFTKHLF